MAAALAAETSSVGSNGSADMYHQYHHHHHHQHGGAQHGHGHGHGHGHPLARGPPTYGLQAGMGQGASSGGAPRVPSRAGSIGSLSDTGTLSGSSGKEQAASFVAGYQGVGVGSGAANGSLLAPGLTESQGSADALARYSALSGFGPVSGRMGGTVGMGGPNGAVWSNASNALHNAMMRQGGLQPATASMVPSTGLGSRFAPAASSQGQTQGFPSFGQPSQVAQRMGVVSSAFSQMMRPQPPSRSSSSSSMASSAAGGAGAGAGQRSHPMAPG